MGGLWGDLVSFILPLCYLDRSPVHTPVGPAKEEQAHVNAGTWEGNGAGGRGSACPSTPGQGPKLPLVHGLPVLHFFNKCNCNILGRL